MKTKQEVLPSTLDAITALLKPINPNVTSETILNAIRNGHCKDDSSPVTETVGRGLTIAEAAKALSVSKPTINRLLNAGKLTRVRVSRRLVRVTGESINRFLAENKTNQEVH